MAEECDLEKVVRDTIMEELNKELEIIREQKFIETYKFDIKKAKVFASYDICQQCKGRGGEWESVYHNDVKFFKCNVCKGTGRYAEGNFDEYFDKV